MMKRKKWTEEEEVTLIDKYGEQLRSGALAKLKTRQKKFDPIADHLNATHHLRNPSAYPFCWTWRDVSVKVQNMRHQYLGVKQKIILPGSPPLFSWADADAHWPNFLKYKSVFGDHDLDPDPSSAASPATADASSSAAPRRDHHPDDDEEAVFDFVGGEDVLGGLGLGLDVDGDDGGSQAGEEKDGEAKTLLNEGGSLMWRKRDRAEEEEWEERKRAWWARRERERRKLEQLEEGIREERRRRREAEERREEQEMEWRARMLGMQMDHEKQMMQVFADSCHNQMQILEVLVRLVCQFFGGGGDALGGGGLPGGLVGDASKGDPGSGAHFM